MKKTRYSDEQIVRILRETDKDTVAEVAKRHGVSEATIYARRKKFGGVGVSSATSTRSRWSPAASSMAFRFRAYYLVRFLDW